MRISRSHLVLGASAAVLAGGLSLYHGFPAGAHAHPMLSGAAHATTSDVATARLAVHTAVHVAARPADTNDGSDPDVADLQQGDQSGPDVGTGTAETPDASAEEPTGGADTDNVQVQQ